jgi:hypothetical protein
MKLEAVHDANGVIVAAIAFVDDNVPRPRPVESTCQRAVRPVR